MAHSLIACLLSLALASLINAQGFGGFGSPFMGTGSYPGFGFNGGMSSLGGFSGAGSSLSPYGSYSGLGSFGGFGQSPFPGYGGFGAGGMGLAPYSMMGSGFGGFQ